MSMKEAALSYLKQGRSVIPVAPGKKHPPLVKWEEYQKKLPTEEDILSWWTETPEANIALVTGAISGVSVIDIDGDDGKESFLHNLQGAIPKTLYHHTPRGAHIIVEYEEHLKQTAGVLPGIDIRNDGGYIIAPPSVVDGKPYTVFRNRPILPLSPIPPMLNGTKPHKVDALADDKPTWVAQSLQGVPEQERNHTATRLIGYFHSKGIPKDIIESQLVDFAARCTPPMSLSELRQTIDSVTRYHQRVREAQITEPPLFRQEGEDYEFHWEQHLIQVRLSEIWHQKDGLHARLDINTTKEGVPPKLLGAVNWNLQSTTGRESLTRYLNKRLELDWPSVLEDTARLAIETYQEREPGIVLSQVVPVDTVSIFPPLLREGEPTMLFGDGGSGKSYLALASAMSVHSGTSLLPFPVHGQRSVLYLDWEANATVHRTRMEELALGATLVDALPDIIYLPCSLSLSEHLRQIRVLISKYGIGVVIIDSAAAATNGEPERAEVALKFFNSLRSLKTTTLIIAHTTKEESRGKPFGSAFWHNEARSTFEIERLQEEDTADVDLGLYHRKANNGKLLKPFGLQLRFTTSTAWFEKADLLAEPSSELAEKAPLRLRIERLLTLEGPSPVIKIAKVLGADFDSTSRTLRRYRTKMFVETKEGVWVNAHQG